MIPMHNGAPAPRTILALLAAAMLLIAASGCVSQLKQPPLEKKYFEIRTAPPIQFGAPVMDAPLRVRRMLISPSYAGKELVYKTSENTYESDYYNLFFIPPADMLSQDLSNWLKGTRIFSHVVDPTSLVNCPYTLEGAINVLVGDYTSKPGQAVVAMQFFLLDERNSDKSILFSRDYSKEATIKANTPEALVEGLNAAVGEIFGQFSTDLKRFVEMELVNGNQGD